MIHEGLTDSFVDLVRRERARILPCTGAGTSIEAGVRDLTSSLIEAGAGRGIELIGDLRAVTEALEGQLGLAETRQLVADVVTGLEVRPTKTYRALARCPVGIVATFNYDDALEQSALEAGKRPKPLVPSTAEAFQPPAEGELIVLHLHGSADRPDSIILPGKTTEALATDEAFLTLVRSLWAAHRLVYLGFSFGEDETHLREALEWMSRELPDAPQQQLLLSERGIEERQDDLAVLAGSDLVGIVSYPETPQHRAVHQAALLIAPTNEPIADAVTAFAREPNPYYLDPPVYQVPPGEADEGIRAKVLATELGLDSDERVSLPVLVGAGRALIVATAGMGKSELLHHVGQVGGDGLRPILYAELKAVVALLDTDRPGSGFARLMAAAEAFNPDTQKATLDRLADGSYLFLLDGFDEVRKDAREAVMNELLAALDEWPQHGYVVATRPAIEAPELLEHGFIPFRIAPSSSWGWSYLLGRGIPEERIQAATAASPDISALISIPMYAARIGERLATGEDLPERPLDLLLDPVQAMARDEAGRRAGVGEADYERWLQWIGLALELRGINEATIEQVAAIPGPAGEETPTTRSNLIEAALLRDVPEVVAFVDSKVQETLCADAILRCRDPVRAVAELALADLDGEHVLRADIEHTLDLIWTNASPDQRQGLRGIDELRWASTASAAISANEAAEAFDVIWDWHADRRIWIDGGRETLVRIAKTHPDAILRRRDDLLAATRSDQTTLRGNAAQVLAELAPDQQTANWLLPLIGDENGVVRRQAAAAAAQLGIRDALPKLQEEFERSLEEQDTFARALVTLATDDELGQVAALLSRWPRVWRGVAESVAGRLPLAETLDLLNQDPGDWDGWRDFLKKILERHPPADWTDDNVTQLSAFLVRHVQLDEGRDLGFENILADHPEAALTGIRAGANPEELSWIDLFFVRHLDRSLLEDELNGPLASAYQTLLSHLDFQAERAEAEAEGNGTESSPDAAPPGLGQQLEDGSIGADRVPTDPQRLAVDGLSPQQREILAGLVDAWWPDQPLAAVVRSEGGRFTANNGALAAVAASVALDLDPGRERWLDVLAASGVLGSVAGVIPWLARHYQADYAAPAGEIVAASNDGWHLYYAVGAFPELVTPVAAAFAAKASLLTDIPRFAAILQALVEQDHAELLQGVGDPDLTPEQAQALREAQAAAGDVEAQLELLAALTAAVEAGERVAPIGFSAAVDDERVTEALGDLLRILGPRRATHDDLQRSVVRSLAAGRSISAVRVYDRLLEDDSFEAAFFYYPRTELARQLATDQVLSRLPSDLGALAEWFENELGPTDG